MSAAKKIDLLTELIQEPEVRDLYLQVLEKGIQAGKQEEELNELFTKAYLQGVNDGKNEGRHLYLATKGGKVMKHPATPKWTAKYTPEEQRKKSGNMKAGEVWQDRYNLETRLMFPDQFEGGVRKYCPEEYY